MNGANLGCWFWGYIYVIKGYFEGIYGWLVYYWRRQIIPVFGSSREEWLFTCQGTEIYVWASNAISCNFYNHLVLEMLWIRASEWWFLTLKKNTKIQELLGALPPESPPGLCPWIRPGALRQAPGPHASVMGELQGARDARFACILFQISQKIFGNTVHVPRREIFFLCPAEPPD